VPWAVNRADVDADQDDRATREERRLDRLDAPAGTTMLMLAIVPLLTVLGVRGVVRG
jgi:hypothetical protein